MGAEIPAAAGVEISAKTGGEVTVVNIEENGHRYWYFANAKYPAARIKTATSGIAQPLRAGWGVTGFG